ncbi:MAG TPA: XRE family transcriptional regulator [Frankiaceae bacterium]|nr:XRE family transcriptional regulator [Frankiaceae bacterium]
MAAKTVPITPVVLAWALEEDGRPLQDIADRIGVKTDALREWQQGQSQPTVGQAAKLAEVLGRPRTLFLLPEPPSVAGLPNSFRHPPGAEELSPAPEVLKLMRRARRVQHATAWALRESPPVEVPTANLNTIPDTAARAAVSWLAWPEPQYPDEWTAWRQRRAALEERDLLVFSLALGEKSVRGFSAWEDHAPLIVVNSTNNSPQVRSFTLLHELGHLLLRSDAACVPTEGARVPEAAVERWCEAFAAAVLIPRAIAESVERRSGSDVDAVRNLARACWISHRAAALRLIELGLAPRELYAQVDALFKPGVKASGGGGERRHEARLREYGPRPLQLVLGSLPARDALSVLRIGVDDVRSLEAELPNLRTAL